MQGLSVARQQLFAVLAQIQSGGRGRIGPVTHHSLPENAVELFAIDEIRIGEVHALGGPRPVGHVRRWIVTWQCGSGEWQLRAVKNRRGSGSEAPCRRGRIKDVAHRRCQRIVQVHRLQSQNLFHCADEVERVICRGDHSIFHICARDVGCGAVQVDVIAAILRVVLNDEDQRVVRVDATILALMAQCNGSVLRLPNGGPKHDSTIWLI